MRNTIVLFNGPPRSGKDTCVAEIADYYWMNPTRGCVQEKFSGGMKKAVHALLGEHYAGDTELERHKEDIIPETGVSYRQMQIDMSEKWMKPLYGEEIFGKLFVRRYNRIKTFYEGNDVMFDSFVTLISDSGFPVEARVVVEALGGSADVIGVRLHRDGCDFTGDSRSYVGFEDFGIRAHDINNNGTKHELRKQLEFYIPEAFDY